MSLMLGIDEANGFVYEGTSEYGAHLLYPPPVIIPARFADAVSSDYKLIQPEFGKSYFFREDELDFTSRIRRGRFYKSNGGTSSWAVQPHSIVRIPHIGQAFPDGFHQTTSLTSCSACVISREFDNAKLSDIVAILGNGKASTIWSIVYVETSFTGEELITLKARQSFGALPTVNWSEIPAEFQLPIREKLSLLEDEYHRASAESVIDHAREVATAILSAYLQAQGFSEAHGKDLGYLVSLIEKKFGKQDKRIVACSAEITQRLHSRRKTSEQQKREIPPIREQDAQLSVQCIGIILCDLGWAEWR